MTYYSGEAFGEQALQTGNPRMGTIIATQTTFCVVVEKDIYLKVLNKLNIEKVQRMTKFLRQIEFMQNWTTKEILQINYLFKLREYKH